MARSNLLVEAKREILREFPQFLEVPPHLHGKEVELGLEIGLDAVAEQVREPGHHGPGVAGREPDTFEELDPREQLLLDAAGQQRRVAGGVGDADGSEEVERGAEPGADVGDQQPGSPVDGVAELRAGGYAGLADEEGEDGGGLGEGVVTAEDLGAHGADAAEVREGEARGVEEVDGAADGGEGGGGGEDGWVGCGQLEEVDAEGG